MKSLKLLMKITNEIRELRKEDSKMIAKLHVLAFPNFFLTSLGIRFLNTFYEKTLKSKNGLGVGVFKDDKIIAFAVGSNQIRGFYKSLVSSDGLSLLIAALPALVFKPKSVLRIIKNIIGSDKGFQPNDGAWLLSICTDPHYQGVGISQQCLLGFEKLCLGKSIEKIWLTTDNQENERANLFYKKMNYQLKNTFSNSNKRKMNLYTKTL